MQMDDSQYFIPSELQDNAYFFSTLYNTNILSKWRFTFTKCKYLLNADKTLPFTLNIKAFYCLWM